MQIRPLQTTFAQEPGKITMKVLVFGTTGQVAIELHRCQPTDVEMVQLGRDTADLTQPDRCANAILAGNFDVIINAAAYTAVDQAESDSTTAMLVNAAAPGAMARAAAVSGIPFVHISTDYVFDGSGTAPWNPNDDTHPLGVYGKSKLAGETEIIASGCDHVILRTSWVFSVHGNNFVKSMLRLGATKTELNIVADQVGGPTAARDLAQAIWTVVKTISNKRDQSGVYHYSGLPNVSWADFAREIFAQSGQPVTVNNIATTEYPTPAQRPANSRLDCSTTLTHFGISQPDWRKSLTQVLDELKEKDL